MITFLLLVQDNLWLGSIRPSNLTKCDPNDSKFKLNKPLGRRLIYYPLLCPFIPGKSLPLNYNYNGNVTNSIWSTATQWSMVLFCEQSPLDDLPRKGNSLTPHTEQNNIPF